MLAFEDLSGSEQRTYRKLSVPFLYRAKKIDSIWERITLGEFLVGGLLKGSVWSFVKALGVTGLQLAGIVLPLGHLVTFLGSMGVKHGQLLDLASFNSALIRIARDEDLL